MRNLETSFCFRAALSMLSRKLDHCTISCVPDPLFSPDTRGHFGSSRSFPQWAEITDKSLIHEHKLRCVFLPGRDAIPEEAGTGAGDVSRFEDSVSRYISIHANSQKLNPHVPAPRTDFYSSSRHSQPRTFCRACIACWVPRKPSSTACARKRVDQHLCRQPSNLANSTIQHLCPRTRHLIPPPAPACFLPRTRLKRIRGPLGGRSKGD